MHYIYVYRDAPQDNVVNSVVKYTQIFAISDLLHLIYVKEMIYLPGILPFFKIHVNQFLAQDDSPAANVTSRHVVGEGPGAIP